MLIMCELLKTCVITKQRHANTPNICKINFDNLVQFGAFWCIFCSDCVLKNS